MISIILGLAQNSLTENAKLQNLQIILQFLQIFFVEKRRCDFLENEDTKGIPQYFDTIVCKYLLNFVESYI